MSIDALRFPRVLAVVLACLSSIGCSIGGRSGDVDAGAPPPARDGGGNPSGADGGGIAAGADGSVPVSGKDAGPTAGIDAGGSVSTGYFPSGAIWYQDVSQAALDSESAQVIAGLGSFGWGNGGVFQIDFSIIVLHADSTTPMLDFTPTGDFYSPDCDQVPMPVPAGGAVEGEDGYACTQDGDCHLLVVHDPTRKLYEMWRANIVNGVFSGGCLVVWDLNKVYPPSERGEQCTSADAAGYAVAPLLFSADEVKAGEIAHAIRFILPNDRIRHGVYVHPSTHSTNPTKGDSGTPPYGAHLRLRADYPLASLPSDGARVVAKALQKYGMFLADGGQIALTAQSDRNTTAKWSGLLDPSDLSALKVSDFEMLEGGTRIPYTGDCVRSP
jgi:serine/threonine-protein kinase